MRRSQASLPFALAAAWLAAGCASLHQGDVLAAAPRVSTDSYYTVADGRRLNLGRARSFYAEAGATEASRHLDQGIFLYRHGRGALLRDMAAGAVLGGLAGAIHDANDGSSRQGYSHNEFGASTMAGALLGFAVALPFGAVHSSVGRQAALPEIQAAARAYNRDLERGRLGRRARRDGWDALPPGLGEADRPAPSPPAPTPAPAPRTPEIWTDGLDTGIGDTVYPLESIITYYRTHGADPSAEEAEHAAALMRSGLRKGLGAAVFGAATGAVAGYLVGAANSGDGRSSDLSWQCAGVGAFSGAALGGIAHVVTDQRRRRAAEARVTLAAELYRRRLAGR